MKILLFILCVGSLNAAEFCESGTPVQFDEPPRIFMLGGQSNMMGTAVGNGPNPSARILSFGLDRQLHIAEEPLCDGTGAVDTELVHGACGVGPSLFAANLIEGNILLIPSALGSTSITRWVEGGDLFDLMIERTEAAKALFTGETVVGVFFWQGESDTGTEEAVDAWPANFASFVTGVRNQYGNIPIVFVQITDTGGALRDELRAYQAAVSIPGVYMVSSDGINQVGDHTDEAGYQIVGERIAAVINGL